MVAVASVVIGFIAAVPALGPSSAIVIRRILVGRERMGLAFGAGYILAEGLACMAALWGVELLFYAAPFMEPVLRWLGIAMLLGVGGYFACNSGSSAGHSSGEAAGDAATLGGQFAFGFGMTALNPGLVAGWTMGIGIALSATGIELATWQKWFIPFGIIAGELLWYVFLIALARRFEDHLDGAVIDRIIQCVGIGLVGLAGWTAVQTWTGAW